MSAAYANDMLFSEYAIRARTFTLLANDQMRDAREPLPELLTVTFCAAGFEPSSIALKLRMDGESAMAELPLEALLISE